MKFIMKHTNNFPFKKIIIAEVGSVHDGSFGNACKLIEAAAAAGADVVKFQTHIADAETLPEAPNPAYFSSESRYDYFKRTAFEKEQWKKLMDVCGENNVGFLSSPFSLEAVDLLEGLAVKAYKIASGEVTNLPLLERIAETGKPVYLSSGMNSWGELDVAIKTLRESCDICVMQCTSAYPSPPERIGLNIIEELFEKYGLTVGFSDHADGLAAGSAAAAFGASVIEKHFTFSKLMYGSDAANGTEPEDFKQYCRGIREIWRMLENPVDKSSTESYVDMKKIFEKSIVSAKDLEPNTLIQKEHLAFKKPGDGIPAANYKNIIGRITKHSIKANKKLKESDLQ